MPIKNMLKIFSSKFSMIYSILIYMFFVVVIIASISIFAIIPVYDFFVKEGIADMINELITKFVINGYSSAILEQLIDCVYVIKTAFISRSDIVLIVALYIVLVLGVLLRLLVGMLEVPLLKKLQGAMSDNANYGFFGLFLSTFAQSALYSIAKIVVKIFFDAIAYLIAYGIIVLMINSSVGFLTPFVLIVLFVFYNAFKYGITVCWGSYIAIDEKSIFKALALSAKQFFNNFSRIYGIYVILWFLIVLLNFFVFRYTFGGGIILTVPISVFAVNILNITYFYTVRNYRYYAGEVIVDPLA